MDEKFMGKILIVEDEPLEQAALCGKVKRNYPETVQIWAAEDGIEAYEICEKKKPDIVLVDINIPGMSGLELIQMLIKKHFSGKILIITAYDTSDYIRQALSLGVVGYLLKPVSTKELKESVDKCIRLLKKEKEQKEKEMSQTIVSSYAEQYLVRDILEGSFPEATLRKAYQWGADGKLNVSAVGIFPVDNTEVFMEWKKMTERYFSIVSATVDETVLLFLKPRTERTRQETLAILQGCIKSVWKSVKNGAVIASEFADTYQKLYENSRNILEKISKSEGIYMERTAADSITDRTNGIKLCRKWEQRLREGNTENFVRMFRRKVSETKQFWGCVSLFLTAFASFDCSADLFGLLDIFEKERPYTKLEKWLEEYYRQRNVGRDEKEKNMIQFAITWMKEHFAEDISRFTVAAKLGLTETYFSHLFKQETGQSFVHMLTEIRIQHAKEMIDAGVTDMDQISKSCGYYNKKYFFEVFKRFTGYRITDYQRKKGK